MSKGQRNDYFVQRGYTATLQAVLEVGPDAPAEAAPPEHVVEGYAAVYEQETMIRDVFGEFVEVIRTGAFDDTDFSDVRLLVNHDPTGIALARSRHNNRSDRPNTMQLGVDASGIRIRANLDVDNNEQARALYSAVGRGDLDGMSFCMFVPEDGQRWSVRNGMDYREITRVEKVIEVSAVNFPAYPGTNIDKRSLESDRRALESARARRSPGNLPPEGGAQSTPDYRAKAIILMYGGKQNGNQRQAD